MNAQNLPLDLRDLQVLRDVIESGSFSATARRLGLAQPTVSQRIAKLETSLGGRLFERVGHDVHLTDLGRNLGQLSLDLLERQAEFLGRLRAERIEPSGLVRYAMPESCQWTPHFRRIMTEMARMPLLRFEIGIWPNDDIVKGLLEGRLDFGFIVGERSHSELKFERFSMERYAAVAAHADLLSELESREGPRLIAYPGWEPMVLAWARAHGFTKKRREALGTPSISIGTLAGALQACRAGAGVLIAPCQCVEAELREKSLREYRPQLREATGREVHLVRRRGEQLPKRCEIVLEALRKSI